MLFRYRKVDIETNQWIVEKAEVRNSVHEIACEAVYHDLNVGYYEEVDGGSCRSLEDDASTSFWSGEGFYSSDDVFRLFIDGERFLYGHMYLTTGTNQRIVVVAYIVPEEYDFWDDEVVKSLSDLECAYFVVEY